MAVTYLSGVMAITNPRWHMPMTVFVLLCAGGMSGTVVVLAPPGGLSWLAVLLGVLFVVGLAWLTLGLAGQALRGEEERQAMDLTLQCVQEAVNELPLGVAIYDQHDRLLMFNREAAELPPYRDGSDLIGQTYETMIRRSLACGSIADALGREDEWLRERLAGRGKLNRPLLRPRPDGRWMHFYELSTPSGCLVMARLDVTELVQKSLALERSNEQLQQLSATDALTGLANRRQFDQHLHSEWQRSMRNGQPVSLLMLDIDHFKRYNDHYGHLTGDACLRQVASILFDCAQRAGELVARYGGEEFALLLPAADGDAAMAIAQRCVDEIARARIRHANSPMGEYLTVSIGVATVVASQDLIPESLVRSADEALYRVKSNGRAHMGVAPCPA